MLRIARFVFALFVLGFSCLPIHAQSSEITLGAQAWSFDRVYPLLDGLFQDAASTQVAGLTLNPNSANGTQLDALVQSLQIQAGYNQLSGIQNNVAAQMSVANLGYQSLITQQEQSILQQQLTAQQQLAAAQQAYANATQSGDTTEANAANQQVIAAQANVASLAAQMTLVKGNAATTPWSPTGGSAMASSAPTTVSSSVPSSLLSAGTTTAGPSFPATKQLDNQMDLLWARLARVVGAMTRPDSIQPGDRLYLLEFDTGTFPKAQRKGQLLETRYNLSCTDSSQGRPKILDMFPRVAAVNIAETNYRDNNIGLGAVLAWLGFGINASYNREHLQLSQTLGQSSYITGYGVGQQDFGWKFGIPLGSKILSSDTKRTFALVRVPAACEKPLIKLAGTAWSKPKASPVDMSDSTKYVGDYLKDVDAVMDSGTQPSTTQDIASLDFNRVAYDPSKYSSANPAIVTLAIRLTQPLDQQAIVYANGQLIRRVRDTFGRGIPTGGGSSGLLESTSIASANTWMPTSSKSLLVNLDGGQFAGIFPSIRIVSPSSTYTIGVKDLRKSPVSVSGIQYQCIVATCALPSLAYRQPTASHVGVARLSTGGKTKIVFTVTDAAKTNTTPSSATSASVQLVTSTKGQVWGSNVEVYVSFPVDDSSNENYRLSCDPTITSADRLICSVDFGDFTTRTTIPLDNTKEAHFHVLDPGHVGGPLEAWTVLAAGNTLSPIVWNVTDPHWNDSLNAWMFQVDFANVPPGRKLTISSPRFSHDSNFVCTLDQICSASFSIAPEKIDEWYDNMQVSISGITDYQASLSNVKTLISPTVSSISDDSTSWSGSNLSSIFSTVTIGKAGTPVAINCVRVSCILADGAKLPSKSGYMFLNGNGLQELLTQVKADGSSSPINYQPPKQNATQNPPPTGTPGSGQNAPLVAPGTTGVPNNPPPPSTTKQMTLEGGPTPTA
jgi:hypothetical protein